MCRQDFSRGRFMEGVMHGNRVRGVKHIPQTPMNCVIKEENLVVIDCCLKIMIEHFP